MFLGLSSCSNVLVSSPGPRKVGFRDAALCSLSFLATVY